MRVNLKSNGNAFTNKFFNGNIRILIAVHYYGLHLKEPDASGSFFVQK